ncbi:MAG: hypothetical protein HY272_01875 [Gammaproteobacteria bacterium]|nr:hypothetical protein [Gammaproteobacteria bacterium]
MTPLTHIDPTHTHVCEVLREIGSHSDCNFDYTAGLARRLTQFGPIEDLTVRELLERCRAHNDYYNHLFAPLASISKMEMNE